MEKGIVPSTGECLVPAPALDLKIRVSTSLHQAPLYQRSVCFAFDRGLTDDGVGSFGPSFS